MPKLSVVTATYNHAAFLGAAMRSVLDQEFGDLEILLVDDASADGTDAILDRLEADPRITVMRNETNRGISATRNRGLAAASGTYLWLLDSDDLLEPGAVGRMVAALDAAPADLLGLYGDYHSLYPGRPPKPVRPHGPEPRPRLHLQFLFPDANPILPSASIFRLEPIRAAGGFDPAFSGTDDRELWTRLVPRWDIARAGHFTARYRRHAGQTTAKTARRRYFRDLTSLRFLEREGLDFFLGPDPAPDRVLWLARGLLRGRTPLFDTALKVLDDFPAPTPETTALRDRIAAGADDWLRRNHGEIRRIGHAVHG